MLNASRSVPSRSVRSKLFRFGRTASIITTNRRWKRYSRLLTEKALRDDDRGYLKFTKGEAESMRNQVRRRMDVGSASK